MRELGSMHVTAFTGMTGLAEVELGKLKELEADLFVNLPNLKKAVLPQTKTIKASAFHNHQKLVSVIAREALHIYRKE